MALYYTARDSFLILVVPPSVWGHAEWWSDRSAFETFWRQTCNGHLPPTDKMPSDHALRPVVLAEKLIVAANAKRFLHFATTGVVV